MKSLSIICITCILLLTGCKDEGSVEPSNTTAEISTFYLIRHAEKERLDPEDADPELNQEGLGRAMHWAEILDEVPMDAIYSTDYNRTAMTAAPLSVKKNIDVTYYDPRVLDVEQFKKENLNKNVLVVGHSNTTPDFAINYWVRSVFIPWKMIKMEHFSSLPS